MTAIEIVRQAREHQVQLSVRDNQIVALPDGSALPASLISEMREARDELLTLLAGGDVPWHPSVLISSAEAGQAVRSTFVDRYVAYAAGRTDAPATFHSAMAFALLSAVVGRRAVLHLANGDVFPAMWVLILADSTLHRKSTAMDLGRDLLERAARDALAPNDFTPQRFVAMMAERDGQPLLFVRDEFSGFYDALNRLDFMAGLKETLCNVYDGRGFRREKMKPKPGADGAVSADAWKYDVREPFFSMAVATTMDRFMEVARAEDVHSGFLPRFCIVLPPAESSGGRLPVREIDGALVRQRDALVGELDSIATQTGRLTCAPAVFERLDQYQVALEDEARMAMDNVVGIIGGRASWMALRCAQLLAVADGSWRVDVPHLLRGMVETEAWRHNAIQVIGALAPSRFEKRAARVVNMVERSGSQGVGRREVMRALKASKREMDDLQATLLERGEIRVAASRLPAGNLAQRFYPTRAVTAVTGGVGPKEPPGDSVTAGDSADTPSSDGAAEVEVFA